jgi:hypothetical protein
MNKLYLEFEYPECEECEKIKSDEKWKIFIRLAKEKNPFFH